MSATRRWKRGDRHPETGKLFWRYARGYENWVTEERFEMNNLKQYKASKKCWVKKSLTKKRVVKEANFATSRKSVVVQQLRQAGKSDDYICVYLNIPMSVIQKVPRP